MTNRYAICSAWLLSLCAAALPATDSGLIQSGSTLGGQGWKLTWSAVAKPPLSAGQHLGIQSGASHTNVPGGTPVFHRFFADSGSRSYFGYDVVVVAGKTNPAVVKFQALSLRGDQLPAEYGTAWFRAAATPSFPQQTLHAGETIAIDVLRNSGTGQRLVDYIQVTQEPGGGAGSTVSASAGAVAKTIGNPSAPVCIDLYSDFQCPACKAFHETMLPLMIKDLVIPGKVYIVSHELPLTAHAHSREAANYASAAALVGKYQTVADALFLHQGEWGASGNVWGTVAGVLTMPEQRMVQELAKDPAILAQVQEDVDFAMAQKMPGTPTIIVSRGAKHYVVPWPSVDKYALLKSLIDGLQK